MRLGLVIPLLTAGCAGGDPSPAQRRSLVPVDRIPVERRSFSGLAWVRSGWLVVELNLREEAPLDAPLVLNELWRLRPDGSDFSRIALPDDPRCRLTEYRYPTALADGRIGVMKWCFLDVGDRIQPFVYDVKEGNLTPITRPLVERLYPRVYSWDPILHRAITSRSSVICSTLVWLTAGGVEELSFTIEDAAATYRVGPQLYSPAAGDCAGQPRADLPAWSPDGRRIAFFFSPKSIPLSGQARLDAPWHLYVTDPEFVRPMKQVTGIVDPGRPVWSPDSRWLAFSGEIAGRGSGTWLYDTDTGELRRIATWEMRLHAWSPDGRQLAAVERMPAKSDLLLFDVSEITAS